MHIGLKVVFSMKNNLVNGIICYDFTPIRPNGGTIGIIDDKCFSRLAV